MKTGLALTMEKAWEKEVGQ